jgi:hypothetical protein
MAWLYEIDIRVVIFPTSPGGKLEEAYILVLFALIAVPDYTLMLVLALM